MFVKEKAAEHGQALLRQQAEAEKKKAEMAAAKSQQVAEFLEDMLQGVAPSVALGRDTAMLQEILDKTAERVGQELTNQPEVEMELCLILARSYGTTWGTSFGAKANWWKPKRSSVKLWRCGGNWWVTSTRKWRVCSTTWPWY